MTDLDRRLEMENIAQRVRIARMDSILEHRKCKGRRRTTILAERDSSIIELHESMRRQRSYDRAFEAACEDPTGQDLDCFLER